MKKANTVNAYLHTKEAQAALSAGVSRSIIEKVADCLQKHGTMFSTSNDLTDAALVPIHNDTDSDDQPARVNLVHRYHSISHGNANDEISRIIIRDGQPEGIRNHLHVSHSNHGDVYNEIRITGVRNRQPERIGYHVHIPQSNSHGNAYHSQPERIKYHSTNHGNAYHEISRIIEGDYQPELIRNHVHRRHSTSYGNSNQESCRSIVLDDQPERIRRSHSTNHRHANQESRRITNENSDLEALTSALRISSDSEPVRPSTSKSLEEENRQLKETRLCKICLDKEIEVVLLPCKHFATCSTCTPSLECCPLCRTDIVDTIKPFLS